MQAGATGPVGPQLLAAALLAVAGAGAGPLQLPLMPWFLRQWLLSTSAAAAAVPEMCRRAAARPTLRFGVPLGLRLQH